MDLDEHLSSTRDYFTYVLHRVDGFPEEDGTTLQDALRRLADAVQLAQTESDDDLRKHWLGLSLQRLDKAESSLRDRDLLEVERHLDDAKDYFENAMQGREITDELISGFDDLFADSDEDEDDEPALSESSEGMSQLMERMASGMSRQEAIDQLVAWGLSEEDADDREASLRKEVRQFQKRVPEILGDLARGQTNRENAIEQLKRMNMRSADAAQAVDDFLGDLNLVRSSVPKILATAGSKESITAAIARLEELGFTKPHATQLVRLGVDINAFQYREITLLGAFFTVAAILMGAAFLVLGVADRLAYMIATVSIIGGSAIAGFGLFKGRKLAYDKHGLFARVLRGSGRRAAILYAVDSGMDPAEASALVNTSMDRLTNIYNSMFWQGLASIIICTIWFALLTALRWQFAWFLLPVAAAWAFAATWRGLVGVQVFGRQ